MTRFSRSALQMAVVLLALGCVPGQLAEMAKEATKKHVPEDALPAIGEPLAAGYSFQSLRTSGSTYSLGELRDTVTVLALWGESADSQAFAMRELDSLYARFGHDVQFVVLADNFTRAGLDSALMHATWAHEVGDIVAAHEYIRPIFDRSGGALSAMDGEVWWQLPAFLAIGPDAKVAARSIRHPLTLAQAIDSLVTQRRRERARVFAADARDFQAHLDSALNSFDLVSLTTPDKRMALGPNCTYLETRLGDGRLTASGRVIGLEVDTAGERIRARLELLNVARVVALPVDASDICGAQRMRVFPGLSRDTVYMTLAHTLQRDSLSRWTAGAPLEPTPFSGYTAIVPLADSLQFEVVGSTLEALRARIDSIRGRPDRF